MPEARSLALRSIARSGARLSRHEPLRRIDRHLQAASRTRSRRHSRPYQPFHRIPKKGHDPGSRGSGQSGKGSWVETAASWHKREIRLTTESQKHGEKKGRLT